MFSSPSFHRYPLSFFSFHPSLPSQFAYFTIPVSFLYLSIPSPPPLLEGVFGVSYTNPHPQLFDWHDLRVIRVYNKSDT